MNVKTAMTIMKRLNKKQLYGILVVGVLLLMFSAQFGDADNLTRKDDSFDYLQYTSNLEKGLARILNRVQGVTEAEVMITLQSGFEYVPAYETETDGYEKGKEEQKKFIVLKKGGSEEAFVLKEQFPEVQGVLVIAKGVESSETERNIVEAVKTVFNISSNRVKVLEK